MFSVTERLVAHWRGQGLEPAPGVPEAELREFEARHQVSLPPDLRAYFVQVNGMGSRSDSDDDFFSFWPIHEVQRVSDDDREWSSYFIFADHSIELPAYAIRLTCSEAGPHPVIAITCVENRSSAAVVAVSFSHFVERYLHDEQSRGDLSVGFPFTIA